MVVHVPFSCWVHVGNASYLSSRAALFIWKLPEVRRNHMTYEPFDFFLGDYYEIFLLGTVVEWNFSCQLGAGHCWYLKYVPPANHAEFPIVSGDCREAFGNILIASLVKAGMISVFWWCFGYVPCIELVVGSVGFYSVTVSLLNLLRDDDYHGRTISSQIACTLSLLTVPTQTIDPPPTTVDATSLSPPPEPSPTPAHRRSVS
ncbi:hypothetical protein RHGRI_018431 [Rhododendron griersonianum]|uniref:Uncharacterized protein n=1 Tax=Rhododendron griersonianum TaxID=479676 RepID=A0AAV6K1M7_9ERIC|nr:hypothetical protein RHGRI_018431 [Rhododendron griersonianum]